jgi:hypothetical protein
MTRDDIIRMAREAGWPDSLIAPVIMAKLAEFAALVAAAERKECADLCKYVYTEVLDDRDGIAKLCEGYILGRGQA